MLAKPGDLGAWLEVGVPLILALFYAIAQIFNRERKTPPPQPTPVRPAAPSIAADGGKRKTRARRFSGTVAATQQKSDPLLAEIQKFLKLSEPEPKRAGADANSQSSCRQDARIEPSTVRGGRVVEGFASDSDTLDSLQYQAFGHRPGGGCSTPRIT